ncbi:host attachment protein [Mesobaculum littorinae]|uniref:Host attachment protein n=1 Tax=Mesobaculum littorinae TaxID=2486419 RepID=A0A438AJ85_9RHOB|nr:host attachment family protein [Mesobaculum littorinae]RVV98770.1 host attachment protein [Mesobaculum littorinae]
MSKITTGTYVLVADGEKALFLRNDGDAEDLHLVVASKKEQENPATHDQGTHKPGRMGDTGVGQRSALADTDWHQLAKDRFADDLADLLYTRVHKGEIERLVIVAAPGVLGELRDKLHKEVEACVVSEVPKTLTNHPVDEIEKSVAAA